MDATTVDVNAILDELNAAHAHTVGATATTMTFVVYVDDPEIAKAAVERSRTIVEKYPARLLLLDGTREPSAPHDVRTVQASSDDRTFARAELIHLGTRGLDPDVLKSVAHAFELQDVPTVLFWAGRGILNDPAFFALNDVADSLVLDSSRLRESVDALRELTEYFAQERRYAVQDLAYLRLTPWQEMIAQFFDDDDAGELLALRSVEIAAGSQAEEYYLLGWLSSRLQWSPCGPGEFCNARGETVRFTLKREGSPRRVYGVTLRSSDAVFRASLKDERDGVVVLSVEGAQSRPNHCETLHDLSAIALIERAILLPATDDVYRATVEAARAILDRQVAK